MAKKTANIIPAASVVEEWLQRDLNQDSGKEFGINLSRFKRYWSTVPRLLKAGLAVYRIPRSQHRVGVLIDNLEPALDKDGKLIFPHRDYIELLRILADSQVQSTTIITSRDRLCSTSHSIHPNLKPNP